MYAFVALNDTFLDTREHTFYIQNIHQNRVIMPVNSYYEKFCASGNLYLLDLHKVYSLDESLQT